MGIVADVQSYLQSISPEVVDGGSGWASVRRRVHDGSDQLVIITEDGGLEPETPSPSGIGDSALAEPAVQVRVRGAPWDGDSAEAKAREIYNALHGLLNQDVGTTYYMRIKAQTEPIFIGYDTKNRPEYTISFRARQRVA